MADERAHDEIFCRHCGEAVKEQAELCPSCGVRNDPSVTGESPYVYCQSCGEQIKSEAEICPECGVKNGIVGGAGSTSGSSGDTVRIVSMVFGAILLLAGFGALTDGDLASGAFLLVVGTALLPQVRDRISVEYSLTRVGYVSDTREFDVRDARTPCVACQQSVDEGVAREYARKFVLFGVPLYTDNEGRNVYCNTCASEGALAETSAYETDQASTAELER